MNTKRVRDLQPGDKVQCEHAIATVVKVERSTLFEAKGGAMFDLHTDDGGCQAVHGEGLVQVI